MATRPDASETAPVSATSGGTQSLQKPTPTGTTGGNAPQEVPNYYWGI